VHDQTQVCIFIGTCSNSCQVLNYTYDQFKELSADLNIPLIAGSNASLPVEYPFDEIFLSDDFSSWKSEIVVQLENCRKTYTHVIFLLDDMYIANYDKKLIKRCCDYALENSLKHMLLRPPEETVWIDLKNICSKMIFNSEFQTLRKGHPYQKSLKPGFWELNHFLECISKSTDIWDFEMQKTEEQSQYPTRTAMTEYHIVEKGLLRNELMSVLNLNFYKNKNLKVNQKSIFSYLYRRIKMKIFGYLFFKIKRALQQ
jgi:hypothetical protein